jgi:hypothetical protein
MDDIEFQSETILDQLTRFGLYITCTNVGGSWETFKVRPFYQINLPDLACTLHVGGSWETFKVRPFYQINLPDLAGTLHVGGSWETFKARPFYKIYLPALACILGGSWETFKARPKAPGNELLSRITNVPGVLSLSINMAENFF